MFPTLNGLGQNIADAQQVREQRLADELNGQQDRAIGGPLPDPNWDAFFGALQRKQDEANDAGMNFKVGLGNFGNLRPSLQALRRSY